MPRRSLETAVGEFAHAIGLLVRRLRAAAASHELSLSETAVLGRLAREGAATTADLARAEGVRPQSMGATVGTLEEMGMVERRPDPTDGRQLHVALTARGAAVRQGAGDAKRTWLVHAVTQLDEKDRDTLFAAGRIIERLLRQ